MILSLIFAMDEANTIGKEGKLPWHLPADLKKFKEVTMGHHIIMGRKTWQSIGKLLPGRTSVIVTRNSNFIVPGAIVSPSLESAIMSAKNAGENEAFVIGGAQLFESAIPMANKFYLTRIHHTFEGDTFLPPVNMQEWDILDEEYFPEDEKNPYPFTFYILQRKNSSLVS